MSESGEDRIVVERIEHAAVMVTDVARAKWFYGDVLGMTEVPRPETFKFPGAWYRNGPTDLHLIGQAEADPKSRRHVAYFVSDLHAAARVLERIGYPVLWDRTKIPGIDRFFTNDPDGNRVELMAREVG